VETTVWSSSTGIKYTHVDIAEDASSYQHAVATKNDTSTGKYWIVHKSYSAKNTITGGSWSVEDVISDTDNTSKIVMGSFRKSSTNVQKRGLLVYCVNTNLYYKTYDLNGFGSETSIATIKGGTATDTFCHEIDRPTGVSAERTNHIIYIASDGSLRCKHFTWSGGLSSETVIDANTDCTTPTLNPIQDSTAVYVWYMRGEHQNASQLYRWYHTAATPQQVYQSAKGMLSMSAIINGDGVMTVVQENPYTLLWFIEAIASNGNARLEVSQSKTVNGNARIEKLYTSGYTGIARITVGFTKTSDGIARLSIQKSKSASSNSRLQISSSSNYSGNAELSIARSKDSDANSRLEVSSTKSKNGNARLELTNSLPKNGNSMISISYSNSYFANSRVVVQQTKNINGNSRIEKALTKTVSADSRIQIPYSAPYMGNSMLSITSISDYNSNSRLLVTKTKSQSGNSNLEIAQETDYSGNACLQVKNTKTISGNSMLVVGFAEGYSGTARISITKTKSINANANLFNLPDWMISTTVPVPEIVKINNIVPKIIVCEDNYETSV